MTPQNPLGELRDIHLPEPGGFWPPAPGWWLLALAILLAAAATIWLYLRRRRRNHWLRLAMQELATLETASSRDSQWFSALNALLKKAARTRYPDQYPEALTGDAWVSFLLETSKNERIASRPVVEAIVHSTWQPSVSAEPAQAMSFAQRWLEDQRC
ncbi:MAG: DUF4381 domain-containing protein [Gammaproteobacteria bacterium]|nr:MAG: DUF4381 domain-containing protein [Gammaproteobacteria bacterium]TNE95440.1 MAG: DUF4381 domain-containing protein [Gammaproteobacteria bacterium]